jgi:hypothetical protein
MIVVSEIGQSSLRVDLLPQSKAKTSLRRWSDHADHALQIGDKTFLIAAIMASRHPRITVFAGAFASLVVMSILSAALGRVILGLVPKVCLRRVCAPAHRRM